MHSFLSGIEVKLADGPIYCPIVQIDWYHEWHSVVKNFAENDNQEKHKFRREDT